MTAETPLKTGHHGCRHHQFRGVPAQPGMDDDQSVKQLLEMTVNGKFVSLMVSPAARLLDVIRDQLELTGTKEGCGVGECGACTVLADNRAILSCMTPALSMQGKAITTIEGVAEGEKLHPVQIAFLKHTALQCGYCTPAMILVGVNHLKNHPDATRESIRLALSGTLCRCTGYEQIIDAIEEARDVMSGKTKPKAQPCVCAEDLE